MNRKLTTNSRLVNELFANVRLQTNLDILEQILKEYLGL